MACGGSETIGDGEEEQGESQGSEETVTGDRGSWRTGASLLVGRSEVAVAGLDGKIHAIGGRDTENVGTHEVYDPASGTWEELASLPPARHGFGAATVGGTVYLPAGAPVTGGSQQSDVLATFSLS